MSRRSIRESVFKLVYETDICGEVNDLTVNEMTQNINDDEKRYFDKVFYGIVENRQKIEDIIKKYARAYNYDRLYKVDKALLFVAIYEILYMDDIPYSVSVNEALEIAKIYSTEKSASYINGILASVIKNMEEHK